MQEDTVSSESLRILFTLHRKQGAGRYQAMLIARLKTQDPLVLTVAPFSYREHRFLNVFGDISTLSQIVAASAL